MPTPRKKRRIPQAPPKKVTAKKSDEAKSEEEIYQDFLHNSGIKELAMKIRVMQAQREALGFAPDDRDLLKCPSCGLYEDADVHGFLFTSRDPKSHIDIGLRFEKLSDGTWSCPFCHGKVIEPPYEPPPGFWDNPKPKKKSKS